VITVLEVLIQKLRGFVRSLFMGDYNRTEITKPSLDAVNAELVKVQDAIADKLDRNLDASNQMNQKLDMNSNTIDNVADGHLPTSAVNKRQLDKQILNLVPGGATDNYIHTAAGGVARTLQSRLEATYIMVSDFGAQADGVTDDTVAIQNALNYAESLGGGVVQLMPGTHIISIAESASSNYCISVPANITLRGYGMKATIVTRPAAERAVPGVLIVNKNYDTVGGYLADSNQVFEDFGVTDGATTPVRLNGDLIGIGHSNGCIIQRMWFGNHDQHAVDVAQSRNVIIQYCECHNEVNATGGGTFQLDAGLIEGIVLDGTPTKDCVIHSNNITNTGTLLMVHFGHSDNTLTNCRVTDNVFNGPSRLDASAIGCDRNTSFVDCTISGNHILPNSINSHGIKLLINDDEEITNLKIINNYIKGTCRQGIWVGTDDASSLVDFENQKSVIIRDNYVQMTVNTSTSVDVGGITLFGLNLVDVCNNRVILDDPEPTSASDIVGIVRIDSCKTIDIRNNYLIATGARASVYEVYGIKVELDKTEEAGVTTYTTIKNNYIETATDVLSYHIYFTISPTEPTPLYTRGIISGNTMTGTPDLAHMRSVVGLSDGTNNLTQVDFGAAGDPTDTTSLYLTTGNKYANLPIPATVIVREGEGAIIPQFRLSYSPGTIAAFSTDTEQLNFTVTDTAGGGSNCVGTQIADVDLVAQTFSVLTGNTGTQTVIDATTFLAANRTTGWLKIQVGI